MTLYNNFTIHLNDFINAFKISDVTNRIWVFKMLMPTGDERVNITITKLGGEKLRYKYQVSVTGMFDVLRVHPIGKKSVQLKNHHGNRTEDITSYDTSLLNKKDHLVNEFKTTLNNMIAKIYCGQDNVNTEPVLSTEALAQILFSHLDDGIMDLTFTPQGFVINQKLYPTAKSYYNPFAGETKRETKPIIKIAKSRIQAKPIGYGSGQPTAISPLRVGVDDPELVLANVNSRVKVLEDRLFELEAKFVAMFDTSGKG